MTLHEEYQEKVPGRLESVGTQKVDVSKSLPVADAHVHFLRRDLHPWLNSSKPLSFEGDWTPILGDYVPADLMAEMGEGVEVEAAVHIQANSPDPVRETREVARMGEESGLPIAIVGGVNLAAADAEQIIDSQMGIKGFCGVRQILNLHNDPLYKYGDIDYLNDSGWKRNLTLLSERDLTFDMQLYPSQLGDALKVIDENPGLIFILNHAGMLIDRSLAGWKQWSRGLHELGKRDNIAVKVSGIGSMDHYWTVESIRPLVYECLDAFGIERCMFASNFPVDKLHGSYVDYARACEQCLAGFNQDEKVAFFAGNAERYYRLAR
jgi:predicted TIM-barrel fold metal-dependent hydrolase